MKVYVGSDHAGFELKEKLKVYLKGFSGLTVEDKGAFEFNPTDDYPDFIKATVEAVSADINSKGIVLGGSGQGEAMVANKQEGIRATEYYGGNLEIVKVSREHNDANVLSLGARFINEDEAKQAVRIFLETPFSNEERHIRRIEEM
jgi:ribose 5-phosphate isomerase B